MSYNEFTETVRDEIDRKVRKSLEEQSCRMTEAQVEEIVDFRVREFAKRLVQVFDLEP